MSLEEQRRSSLINLLSLELVYEPIYRDIITILQEDPTIDLVVLNEKLKGKYKASQIVDVCTSVDSLFIREESIKELIELEYKKRVKAYLTKISQRDDITEGLNEIRQTIRKIPMFVDKEDLSLEYARLLYEQRKQEEVNVTTHLEALKGLTNGHRKGTVWVVGGQTGVGKSFFALNHAIYNALEGNKVLFISTELDKQTNYDRLQGNYDYFQKKAGIKELDSVSMIDTIELSTNAKTTTEIVDLIRDRKQKNDIDLVVIDHLQDIEYEGADAEYDSIRKTCLAIKDIAIEEHVAIMLVSQLNRMGQKGDQRQPGYSYLGSSKIEQIAHVAIIIIRNQKEDGSMYEHVEVVVKKNREGRTGYFPADFKYPYFVFEEIKNEN